MLRLEIIVQFVDIVEILDHHSVEIKYNTCIFFCNKYLCMLRLEIIVQFVDIVEILDHHSVEIKYNTCIFSAINTSTC